MESYTPNFFRVNAEFLTYSGLWSPPYKNGIKYYLYKLYKTVVLFSVLFYNPCVVILGVIEHIHDFVIVIEALNVGLTILLTGVKSAFWLSNGERIKEIMHRLETNVLHYEETDGFDSVRMIREAQKSGLWYALLLWRAALLTLAFAYIPVAMLSLWYCFNDLSITGVKAFENLPYYMYVPFKRDTAFKYFLACVLQCSPCFICATVFVGIDSLFMSMMNLIGTHMLIVQGAFRTSRKRCLKKLKGRALTEDGLYNSEELESYMMDEMKSCIEHLQMLFRSCSDIEDAFQYMSFVQALCTMYILCSTLLLISTVNVLTNEFGKDLIYFLGVTLQLGLYCWFGNQLTLKSEGVPLAMWESDWLETRKPYKFCMLVTMMRFKKPVYINAGKFVPLILDTQIAVIKGSYSYYSVLKGMSK